MLLLLLAACTGIDFGDTCVYFLEGCGDGPGVLPDEDVCYETCDPVDEYCVSGTCTLAWINPCADSDCAACGGEAYLCM